MNDRCLRHGIVRDSAGFCWECEENELAEWEASREEAERFVGLEEARRPVPANWADIYDIPF